MSLLRFVGYFLVASAIEKLIEIPIIKYFESRKKR